MTASLTVPFFASRKLRSQSYHLVPAPDEETLLASPDSQETRILSSPKLAFFLNASFWLTALALLSLAVTIRNLFILSQEPHVNYLKVSIGSPYKGLEKLIRNESSSSWPLTSTHYPDFIGATEGKSIHHALANGSIVRLDIERAVVIQHRVRDYGLEHCAVKLEFSRSAGNGRGNTERAYGHIGQGLYLTLWRLEDSENKAILGPSAIPISSPSRKAFLGNITIDGSRPVQSPSFKCNAGSIQTLEIAVACAFDPCIMEFRLARSPQRQGFWIVQSEQEYL